MPQKGIASKAINLVQKLFDEELTYYASSLSFYTIFTITPLLLIVVSILPTFPDFQEQYTKLKEFIFSIIMPVHSEALSGYLDTFLANSSKLGLFGAVMLLVASFLFFQNYEYIVAQIFKTKTRSFLHSFITYISLVTLTPLALMLFFYLSSKLQGYFELNAILPLMVIWLLFYIIYIVSPNETVSQKAALRSSFISALIWNIAKAAFIYYSFYNKTYETIYGSFSILIFFFLWIYLSWIIFLYGLRTCYLLDKKKSSTHK